MYSKIQYISQGATADEQLKNIHTVLDLGYTWVQLRFKNQPESIVAPLAEDVKKTCEPYNATFIVNDHVGIAKSSDAHGVHLGLKDDSVAEARAVLGSDKIIGGTANTAFDVLQRIEEGCNYIGLGPFRFTNTKEKLSPILGLDGYESILRLLQKDHTSIPIYAIGGVKTEDVQSLMQTGLYGIAVSGLLTHNVIPLDKFLSEITSNNYAQ